MFGAIIGDIVGSFYEWNPIKRKDFEFFHAEREYTDDSVCTAAVADILVNRLPPAETMQQWCRRHDGRGYGAMFEEWIGRNPPAPYNSFGNGAAMRASPAALFHRDDLKAALAAADAVTAITHNHPEGMKGARAVVHAVWLGLNGERAAAIRKKIASAYGYDLSPGVDQIRPKHRFDETCQGTVPPALICALEAVNFEDAVRNAISLGGDADTLAAVAGALGEALFGVPPAMVRFAEERYLDEAEDIVEAMRALYRRAPAAAKAPKTGRQKRG